MALQDCVGYPQVQERSALFLLLTATRLGATHRRLVARYWPAVLMGLAGGWMVLRGGYWVGLALLGAALLAWRFAMPKPAPSLAQDPADQAARAVLGVGANATAAEIRAAFRAKMASAHPDRGGSQDAAARLVSARDRLLRRR